MTRQVGVRQDREGWAGITTWIPPHQRRQINRVCHLRGITQSEFLRPMFTEFLDRAEFQEEMLPRCNTCDKQVPDTEPVLDGLCLSCYASKRRSELQIEHIRRIPEPIASE